MSRRFRNRKSPTESLGAGELSSNHLPNQTRYPKESVKSEIDTISAFSPSGRRVILPTPGFMAAGTRRYGGKRRK